MVEVEVLLIVSKFVLCNFILSDGIQLDLNICSSIQSHVHSLVKDQNSKNVHIFVTPNPLVRQIFDNIFSITVFISTRWSNGSFKSNRLSLLSHETILAPKRGRHNDMYIFTVLILYEFHFTIYFI